MLILINNEILLDPYDITEAVPLTFPNPKYVPDMETESLGLVKGNGLDPEIKMVHITYKNGKERKLNISFEDFCKQIQAKAKND